MNADEQERELKYLSLYCFYCRSGLRTIITIYLTAITTHDLNWDLFFPRF